MVYRIHHIQTYISFSIVDLTPFFRSNGSRCAKCHHQFANKFIISFRWIIFPFYFRILLLHITWNATVDSQFPMRYHNTTLRNKWINIYLQFWSGSDSKYIYLFFSKAINMFTSNKHVLRSQFFWCLGFRKKNCLSLRPTSIF